MEVSSQCSIPRTVSDKREAPRTPFPVVLAGAPHGCEHRASGGQRPSLCWTVFMSQSVPSVWAGALTGSENTAEHPADSVRHIFTVLWLERQRHDTHSQLQAV